MNGTTNRRLLVWGGTALFGVFVLLVFLRMCTNCDLHVYHRFARTARAEGIDGLYRSESAEYPPLAIGLSLAVGELAEHLTVPDVLARYNVYKGSDPSLLRYTLAFRLTAAGFT